MHRFARVVASAAASVVAVAAFAVPSPARATTTPTLSGPTVAGYYDLVTLAGTTPLPNEAVDVYAKGGSSTATYTRVRQLTSDSAGHFTVAFRETTDITLYARAGGTNSPTHTTKLRTASCTVSKAAFPKLPITSFGASNDFPDFAAFTANRGSTWAGVAVSVSDARFGIIRWVPGQPVRVLYQFAYSTGQYSSSYEPAAPGSVYVSSVTPHGYLAVTVQEVRQNLEADRFTAYVWRAGALHAVSRASTWKSIHLVGLGADGHLVGWVRTGTTANPKYAVVQWWETGTHYQYLTGWQTVHPFPIPDPAGDLTYLRDDGYYVVRVAETGKLYSLPKLPSQPDGNVYPTAAGPSGREFYGTSDGQLAHWSIGPGGVSAPTQLSGIAAGKNFHWAYHAGPGGELVDGYYGSAGYPQHLLTAQRAYVQIPVQLNVDSSVSGRPGSVLNSVGTLAFTSAADHLPHFLACS